MFGLLQRSLVSIFSAAGLLTLVLLPLLISISGVRGAVLEVEPREVLIQSFKQQERQEQHADVNSSLSEVVREALFSCLEVESDESRHRPRNEVIWMKNGQIIVTRGNRKYRNYGKKKRLLIKEPGEEDSGIYECALSPNSTEKGRAELWIAPQVLSAPSPQVLDGWSNGGGDREVGVVECYVSMGAQYIEWWKDNTRLALLNRTYDGRPSPAGERDEDQSGSHSNLQRDSHYSILVNGSLIISSVSPSDEGVYRCVASNKAGQHGMEIRVIMNGSHDKLETTPIIAAVTTPPNNGDHLNNSTTLTTNSSINCVEYEDFSFGPNPEPLAPSQLSPSTESSSSDGQLHPPYFTSLSPSCVQSLIGYRIVLNCSARGSPSLNITWEKDGEQLETQYYDVLQGNISLKQPHYIQMSDGSLLINPVQFDDGGKYVCRVSNEEGEVSKELRLRVRKTEEVCGRRMSEEFNGSGNEIWQRNKRVADGEVVAGIHEWPWQVLIEFTNRTSLCGGTLIRPDWVLTAAHCLHDNNNMVKAKELIVRVGVYNRSATEHHQQLLQIRDYKKHPASNRSREHDIALLKLVHPVKLTDHVGPACLPPESSDPPVGTLCTVTGWGHLEHNSGWSPELLHMAQVPLVSRGSCQSRKSYGTLITGNMLCAGWKEGGPDACQNDSGGPLVCPITSTSSQEERWAIHGVVNFGAKCGSPHKYGVYARVSKYITWINQQMKLY